MKKERLTTSDEQRERQLIADQIERAKAEAPEAGVSSSPTEGLKRDETSEKVVLSFAPKPVASTSESSSGGGLKLNPLKPSINPLKTNPLKRPNPLKAAAPTASGTSHNDKKRPAAAMTAAERLIIEEQERKRRKMERELPA